VRAATVTNLKTRRRGTDTAGGPTVRAAIDAFLDSPKIKGNPNTLRAYTNVLDRAAEVIGADRTLAGVADGQVADALTELWGDAKPAIWNRNRAAVGSWLAWCADKQHFDRGPSYVAASARRGQVRSCCQR
jgi:hypothetical protein